MAKVEIPYSITMVLKYTSQNKIKTHWTIQYNKQQNKSIDGGDRQILSMEEFHILMMEGKQELKSHQSTFQCRNW